jgi:hypothetical protein
MAERSISGYTYGTAAVPRSPVTLEEFEHLKQTVLFGPDDEAALRQSRDILADQVEQILDVWYGFVGSHPFLLAAFCDPATGQPDQRYLAAVRQRFGQWILDTAAANYDQAWLDYQHEIGLRHHRTRKNQTDGVRAAENVPYRYLPTLVYPIVATLKPFLAQKGHGPEEVERMHQAWLKSVLLQVTLWSYPYVREGDY